MLFLPSSFLLLLFLNEQAPASVGSYVGTWLSPFRWREAISWHPCFTVFCLKARASLPPWLWINCLFLHNSFLPFPSLLLFRAISSYFRFPEFFGWRERGKQGKRKGRINISHPRVKLCRREGAREDGFNFEFSPLCSKLIRETRVSGRIENREEEKRRNV